MVMNWRNCFAIKAVAVSALLFFSCGEEKKADDVRTVFKYNEMGGITSLDPAEASNFENIWAVNQLFNGLVQMNDSLRVIPCIAKSWEISEDGKTYTFHLRKDVFFQDHPLFKNGKGRKVDAADFEYSFFRLFDPSVSRALSLVDIIDRSERSAYKGFVAKDDSTFLVYIKQPFKPFLSILTMKFFSVVPNEIVEGMGDGFRKAPVGTGPFQYKMWEDGNKIVLLKNPNYFEFENGQRLPYLDAVNISFIRDKQSVLFELMRGNLDLISGADAINIDAVFDNQGKLKDEFAGKFQVQTCPYLKTDYLGFLIDDNIPGIDKSPVRLKAVRQAINYGFDRVKMMAYFRNNIGSPATAGFIPPGLPGYNANFVKGYYYNPEKVRQLLAEAGYPEGKNLPDITLHTTEQYKDLLEYIQSQLSQNNIKIKISIEPSAELKKAVSSNEYEFFKKSWVCDYADEENFLFMFHSKNFSPIGQNYFHYKNPDFDALYDKAQKETNDSLRSGYYMEMDKMIVDDAPVVPLYYDQVVRLVSNNISNLSTNAMNLLNLKTVKKANTVAVKEK
jgi:oligopeptide transport system substrate-binding protein